MPPQIRRWRSRNDPYAKERQGLGCQGSHPGCPPEEGSGLTAPSEFRDTLDGLSIAALEKLANLSKRESDVSPLS